MPTSQPHQSSTTMSARNNDREMSSSHKHKHTATDMVRATGASAKPKAGYKSYKKKYRKMRIIFERKMHDADELFKVEAKAAATVKRLAIENDRLLDLLLDINNSSAIPSEKRIDLSLPPSTSSRELTHPLDKAYSQRKNKLPMKRLEDLIKEVPHLSYATFSQNNSDLIKELQTEDSGTCPEHFLTANDIDDYLYTIDTKLKPSTKIPTLAPLAHPDAHPEPHPLLKNPNSATSWLRRHAPQIFLQGSGHEPTVNTSTLATADPHHDDDAPRSSKNGASHATATPKSKETKELKKASAKASKSKRVSKAITDWEALDDDHNASINQDRTPVSKGKRKRIADDDGGYRPKGSGASRPSKKKRKSEGDAGSKSRKKEAADAN